MSKWLFWDIDGTLMDAAGAGQQAMLDALRDRSGTEPKAEDISFAGRTDRGIATDLFQQNDVEDSPEVWAEFCADYVRYLEDHLPSRPASLLPGIQMLLDHLVAREVSLGLLTGNVHGAAQRKLEHMGIWHYFLCGGFGDHHVNRADVARVALQAAEAHARVAPDTDQVWIIGDTPRDIACARAVGARCVAVATGLYSLGELAAHEPDVAFDDLGNFDDLLELWELT